MEHDEYGREHEPRYRLGLLSEASRLLVAHHKAFLEARRQALRGNTAELRDAFVDKQVQVEAAFEDFEKILKDVGG